MPVIQLQNPWEQAAGFATDYVKARQETADRNQKQADAAATAAGAAEEERYKRGRDTLTDTLAANKDHREDVAAKAKAESDKAELEIHLAKQRLDEQMAPLELKLKTAQIGVQQGTLDKDKADVAYKNAQTALEKNKVNLEAKYGAAKAQVMIAEASARIEAAHASAAHSYAGAAHENAETAGVERKLATGGFDGAPRGRGGAGKFDLDSALSSLSPTGSKMYDMLYSTNNPPTPQQAVLAIRNPRNGLSDGDRKALQQIVTQRGAGLETPREQMSDARADARGAATDARRAASATTSENTRQMGTVAKSKSFKNLPVPDQELLQSGVDAHGYSASIGILQGIASGQTKSSTVTPEQAARILKAIGG